MKQLVTMLCVFAAMFAASVGWAGAREVELPAFPGAEGFGAGAVGGRGGRIIKVTNLDADGPGSLQWACNQEGPRIVVFDVSGVIPGNIRINHGQLTIAGQTAPGAGVTIQGHLYCNGPREGPPFKDVIIRFLRVRPGRVRGHSPSADAVQFTQTDDLMVDHISSSWGGDETFSLTTCGYFTMQWCSIEESALVSEGGITPHNFGTLVGYTDKPETIHHNLYAHHCHRTPYLTGKIPTPADIRNNVIYNTFGGTDVAPDGRVTNLVGNYYKEGPGGPHPRRSDIAPITLGLSSVNWRDGTYMYAEGNYSTWGGGYAFLRSHARQMSKTYPVPPVTTHSAEEAYELVLAHAGCLPRDAVSRRTVEEVSTGTGSWGRADPEGGLMAGLRPAKALPDSDNDGMPDDWEKAHGLDPQDPSDANGIVPVRASPGDRHKGYTYIEYYVNELADRLITDAVVRARGEKELPVTLQPAILTGLKRRRPEKASREVADLIEVLRENDFDKRGEYGDRETWRAARALCFHTPARSREALEALIELLKYDNARVRRCAAWVLGCMEPPAVEAVAALAEIPRRDDDATSAFAAWALGRIGPGAAEAVPALKAALGASAPRTRERAAWALGQMGAAAIKALPALLELLGDHDIRVRWQTAQTVANLGESALQGLTYELGVAPAKASAARTLGLMGERAKPALPTLVEALADPDPNVRQAVAEAIGRIGKAAREAAPVLAGLLKDQDADVRYYTAKALGRIGLDAEAAVPGLVEALEDEETMVRCAAAEALGKIGPSTEAAVSGLMALLGDTSSAWARRSAARALAAMGRGAAEAVDALAEALSDSEAGVRREAAWALKNMGPAASKAEEALRKALEDSDCVVPILARKTLQGLLIEKPF